MTSLSRPGRHAVLPLVWRSGCFLWGIRVPRPAFPFLVFYCITPLPGEQADGPYFSPPDSLPLMRFSGPVPFLQFFLIHFAFCIAFFRLARYNSFISAHKCFCFTDISVR